MRSTRPRPGPARRVPGRAALAGLTLAVVLATAACPNNLVHSYKSFEGAVQRGAGCAELFDQRANFDAVDTLARIDKELDRIGCSSPRATRTDRRRAE